MPARDARDMSTEMLYTRLMDPILLISQVETATSAVGAGPVGEAVFETVSAFGVGLGAGFVALFAAIFTISRFAPITELDATKFDWVPWALRAVSVLGGAIAAGVVAAQLLPEGDRNFLTAILAEVMVATPLVIQYVTRTVEEATD